MDSITDLVVSYLAILFLAPICICIFSTLHCHVSVQDFLLSITTPHFYPWELGDIAVPRMRGINAGLSQCMLAAELLHRAAYRDRGLGMSQYAPNHMVRRFPT